MNSIGFVCCLASILLIQQVAGHGYQIDPAQRSSMWRLGYDVPPNYYDMGLNCGTYDVFMANGKKCGLCGDDYNMTRPRPNETGGQYATGILAAEYKEGQTMSVTIHIGANHMGYYEWRLCARNDPNEWEEQECFDQHVLELADGSGTRYNQTDSAGEKDFIIDVNLPNGVTCSHCVLQWRWKIGGYGDCGDGTWGMGCGDQETYQNCADISIS